MEPRKHPMAIPEKKRPTTLEEAVEQLKSDPLQAVRLHVNDVDVEVRLVKGGERKKRLGDFMAEVAVGRANRQTRFFASFARLARRGAPPSHLTVCDFGCSIRTSSPMP